MVLTVAQDQWYRATHTDNIHETSTPICSIYASGKHKISSKIGTLMLGVLHMKRQFVLSPNCFTLTAYNGLDEIPQRFPIETFADSMTLLMANHLCHSTERTDQLNQLMQRQTVSLSSLVPNQDKPNVT